MELGQICGLCKSSIEDGDASDLYATCLEEKDHVTMHVQCSITLAENFCDNWFFCNTCKQWKVVGSEMGDFPKTYDWLADTSIANGQCTHQILEQCLQNSITLMKNVCKKVETTLKGMSSMHWKKTVATLCGVSIILQLSILAVIDLNINNNSEFAVFLKFLFIVASGFTIICILPFFLIVDYIHVGEFVPVLAMCSICDLISLCIAYILVFCPLICSFIFSLILHCCIPFVFMRKWNPEDDGKRTKIYKSLWATKIAYIVYQKTTSLYTNLVRKMPPISQTLRDKERVYIVELDDKVRVIHRQLEKCSEETSYLWRRAKHLSNSRLFPTS
jgi:hypothetical protein